MPIFKGADKIAAIYKGSTAIARVYGGDDLVFEVNDNPPGELEPHRYWRLAEMQSRDVSNTTIAELKVYSEEGGSPLAFTATASSTFSGRPASNVTDNNSATLWSSATSDRSWLAMDFGTPVGIHHITATIDNSSFGPPQGPMAYTLQYSDDGSTWTTFAGSPGVRIRPPRRWTTAGQTQIIYDSRSYGKRYWRMTNMVAQNAGAYIAIGELTFHETDGGPSIPYFVEASSSYETARNQEKMQDGNPATNWLSNGTPASLFFDLGEDAPENIYEIIVMNGPASEPVGRSLSGVKLEWSTNLNEWTVAWTNYNFPTWSSSGETKAIDAEHIAPPPPTSARYWRATNWVAWSDSNVSLGSVQFYEDYAGSALPYTATSDGDYPGRPVTGMPDTDPTTTWTPTGGLRKLQADFGVEVGPIVKMDIYTSSGFGGNWHQSQGPLTFNLDLSLDGLEWFRYASNQTTGGSYTSPGEMKTVIIVPD